VLVIRSRLNAMSSGHTFVRLLSVSRPDCATTCRDTRRSPAAVKMKIRHHLSCTCNVYERVPR
jgi:hypothetical protein